MYKKKTSDTFVLQSRNVHGDKYDYSKVEYVNNSTKVCIICPEHGEFWKTPKHHLYGQGCPLCAKRDASIKRTLTTDEFIEKARKIHRDKYDYSKVKYVNNSTKVCIICPEHGEFWMTPHNHLANQGCPKCSGRYITDTNYFIKKAKQIHGSKYDYSKVEYKDSKTKICIICPKHGEFWQTPQEHLQHKGCKECGFESVLEKNTKSTEDFIKQSNIVHHYKYDYSKAVYINSKTPLTVICPEHGEFLQIPLVHLKGFGCPKCSNKYHYSTDDFIKKVREIHGDKYDYSKVEYVNATTKICIICPIHGEFWQRPYEHLQNRGCPSCSHSTSKEEVNICNYLHSIDIACKQRVKNIINPYELDIYIPDKKLAIEYNGVIWHSEKFGKDKNYHLMKTELCEKQGIRLIHIFEDEWIEHEEIVKSKLKHILGCDMDLPKIFARKCIIKEIDVTKAREFLEKNHIQGFSRSSVYLGCFYNGNLVGVMSFKKETKDSDKWELTRFATDINKHCVGVGGKLFKYFVNNYNPSEVKSFADRRWTMDKNNNLYIKLGFYVDNILKPDYHYVVGNQRLHKFGFRKKILLKKYPNSGLTEDMTEHEICQKLGFQRIYDCGLIKYKWVNM